MAAHEATTLGMLVAVFWVVSQTRVGVPAPDVSLTHSLTLTHSLSLTHYGTERGVGRQNADRTRTVELTVGHRRLCIQARVQPLKLSKFARRFCVS